MYEREVANIERDFREARLSLPKEHVVQLRRLEQHYQREGNLSALLAVQEERQRFVLDPRASSMPSVREPDYLVQINQQYREHYAEAAEQRITRLRDLHAQYRSALQRLQTELTQQGEIDDARTVFSHIQGLEAARASVPVPSAQVQQRTVRPTVSSPPPAAQERDARERARQSFEEDLTDWF